MIYVVQGLFCAVDSGRDQIQPVDVPTSLPFPERYMFIAANDSLKESRLPPSSPVLCPSSLPAPPRLSSLLPPPPRVSKQNTDIDSQDRDSIGGFQCYRAMPETHDNPTLTNLVMAGGWIPPRQSHRSTRDHTNQLSAPRDSQPPHYDFGRRFSSNKWQFRRSWSHPYRARSSPSRHHQHVSRKSRYEEDVPWQSNTDNCSVNKSQDEDT